MDPLAGNVPQRPVDPPLPLHPRNPGKGSALDLHGEMRFVRAVMPGMAAVAGTVVDHLQPARRERGGQQLGDFLGYGTSHVISFGVSI